MIDAVKKVCEETKAALRELGLNLSAEVLDDNLTGDEGMDGYVLVDDHFAIYPQEVDGIHHGVGWGVSAETIIPGRHSMANGDPGYPDEPDVVDIALPYVESKTLVGDLRFPRTARHAVSCAVRAAVDWRLDDWLSFGGGDDSDDNADAG